jgi:hypothetical protein
MDLLKGLEVLHQPDADGLGGALVCQRILDHRSGAEQIADRLRSSLRGQCDEPRVRQEPAA